MINNNREWKDVFVKFRESYSSPVFDFHEHDYYELNFIFSGNVKIILKDIINESDNVRVLITKPNTSHFVSCDGKSLYLRQYLLFDKKFIDNQIENNLEISSLFTENGRIISLNARQADTVKDLLLKIHRESSLFRKRLLVLYLLSFLKDFACDTCSKTYKVPPYILGAIKFIEENYSNKISAETLTKQFFIGRTTLLTNFKKHTGYTLHDYLTEFRLKKAIKILEQGSTVQETAEACGFLESSGFIRSFKKYYKLSPMQYLKSIINKT